MKKPLFSYKKTKLVGKWHRFTVFTNILMFGFTDPLKVFLRPLDMASFSDRSADTKARF